MRFAMLQPPKNLRTKHPSSSRAAELQRHGINLVNANEMTTTKELGPIAKSDTGKNLEHQRLSNQTSRSTIRGKRVKLHL